DHHVRASQSTNRGARHAESVVADCRLTLSHVDVASHPFSSSRVVSSI
ncbi:unnamed protein product, partial [Heterotrigona itama]